MHPPLPTDFDPPLPAESFITIAPLRWRGRGRPRCDDAVAKEVYRLLWADFNRGRPCSVEGAVATVAERHGMARSTVFQALKRMEGRREW
jgi:hypothetical protein